MSTPRITVSAGNPAFTSTVSLPVRGESGEPAGLVTLLAMVDRSGVCRSVELRPFFDGISSAIEFRLDGNDRVTIIEERDAEGNRLFTISIACGDAHTFDYVMRTEGMRCTGVLFPKLRGSGIEHSYQGGRTLSIFNPIVDSTPAVVSFTLESEG